MKIRLLLEYDGSDFQGWQRQAGRPTIQESLESVLSDLHDGNPVIVTGAGRTDSGVHAFGQVAHFSTDRSYSPERWSAILNWKLPRTIRVIRSEEAPRTFHAQRDATGKLYRYVVLNRPQASALRRRVLHIPYPLNWDRIQRALPYFCGTHDFRAFQGAKADVKTTNRTIYRFSVKERRGGYYQFDVLGNGFLKQMVRTMIGTVLEVGENKRAPESIEGLIQSQDRRKAGRTAPPQGLFLMRVYYGDVTE